MANFWTMTELDYETDTQFFERTGKSVMACIYDRLEPKNLKGSKMPCSDGGPSEAECRAERVQEISTLTEMLCSACRALKLTNFDFDLNPQLSKWWSKHQKEDAKREFEEQKLMIECQQVKEICDTIPLNKMTLAQKQLLRKYKIMSN